MLFNYDYSLFYLYSLLHEKKYISKEAKEISEIVANISEIYTYRLVKVLINRFHHLVFFKLHVLVKIAAIRHKMALPFDIDFCNISMR